MRIDILTRGLQNDQAAKERVNHRLRFALGRFVQKIASVQVTLEDTNGPRGGVDKRCRLRLVLRKGGEPLLAEDTDPEIAAAIDRAALRLSRMVGRAVNRAGRPSRATLSSEPQAPSRSGVLDDLEGVG